MPDWDFTRGPIGSRLLLAAAQEAGLDADDVLRGTGLTEAGLQDQAALVEAGQELQVARNIVALADDPQAVALATARRVQVSTFGVWGFAIVTSPTWGEALAVALRFAQLTSTFLSVVPEVDGSELQIDLDDGDIPEDVRDFLALRDIGVTAALVGVIVGPDSAMVARCETRFPPDVVDELRTMLPSAVRVSGGRPRHLLAVDSGLLARPLPDADAATRRACEAECARIIDARTGRTGVAQKVRGRLLEGPVAQQSMESIARDMHVDVRTLRRHLTAEGTSFRALRDEVCLTLATELLVTVGLSVTEVAQRLGYADATSFTHVFSRIAGHPPSQLQPTR